MIADHFNLGIGSLWKQIRKWCSHDSLPNNRHSMGSFCCNSVILRVLIYKTGHNFVYCHYLPYRTLINDDARPKIVDTPWTVIFKIEQEACGFFFGLYRRSVLYLCITMTKSHFNYLTYKTKHCCHSVDAHVQDQVRSMSLSVMLRTAAYLSFRHICD